MCTVFICIYIYKESFGITQGGQCPLIMEYSLNHIRGPSTISAIFLNQGVLGSLGSTSMPRESRTCQAQRGEFSVLAWLCSQGSGLGPGLGLRAFRFGGFGFRVY